MRVSNSVTQSNGVIIVTLTASFAGDPTDPSDKQKIAAFGDPIVNYTGKLLVDPNNPSFTFGFQSQELNVGVTTQMQNYTARFLTGLPPVPAPPPGQPVAPSWFETNRQREHHEIGIPTLGPSVCIDIRTLYRTPLTFSGEVTRRFHPRPEGRGSPRRDSDEALPP